MAEFVRAQIFGTTFEITSRYEAAIWSGSGILQLTVDQVHRSATGGHGSIWSGLVEKRTFVCPEQELIHFHSSAKDQLTQQAVAVKKIMKPFSTPVLSKRTYRELKLLKHLRHENVGRIY